MTTPNGVTVTIDGVATQVPAGTSIVDAANAVGIEIPIFCHHPNLEPVGMCRMCLVEVGSPAVDRATGQRVLDESGNPVIQFMPKLQAGCTTRAAEGLVIRTTTPAVAEARESVLEFLLTSHPLDCPVCDKGGECPLQNLTMRYGPGKSRFNWGEKYRFPKPVPIGPLVVLDRERCVLCARCIRFEDEIAADSVLGFENRGRGMEIVSFSDPPFASYFSGNTSDICPVGALTTKDFRFEARAWEVVGKPSVCVHCPVGCNTMLDTRFVGQIERVMPRRNDAVNEIWLCDKGRFAHHYASAPDRLTTPLVRRDGELVEATWEEALGEVAERLKAIRDDHGPAAIGGIAGDGLPNEDLYLFGRFLRAIIRTNNVDHRPGIVRDDTIARFGAGAGTRLTDLGRGTTVVVVGLDVEEEAPVLFLNLFKAISRGAKVVLLGGRPQKLEPHAEFALRWRYGAEAGLVEAFAGAAWSAAVDGVHPVREEDFRAAVDAVAAAENVLVIYGREAAQLGLVPHLAAIVEGTGRAGTTNNGLVAVGPHANSQGAADMGLLPDWLPGYRPLADADARAALADVWPAAPPEAPGIGAGAMLAGGVRALYVLGTDPAGDDPRHAAALEAMDLVVVHELFLTETARRAHVVLPARSVPEREGTFTSMTRRVQRFYPAVKPVGRARQDWKALRDLGQRLGVAEPYAEASDVMAEIARAVPSYAGLSYDALGAPAPPGPTTMLLPFAPIAEARKVSYAGTAYENAYGEGVVWAAGNGHAGAPGSRAEAEPATRSAVPKSDAPRHAASAADGRLTLVVTRILYDTGTLTAPSTILHPLVPSPYVEMSPFDATALGLADGARVRVTGEGGAVEATLRVRDGITPGTVLAPESLAWAVPVRAVVGGESRWVRLSSAGDSMA